MDLVNEVLGDVSFDLNVNPDRYLNLIVDDHRYKDASINERLCVPLLLVLRLAIKVDLHAQLIDGINEKVYRIGPGDV